MDKLKKLLGHKNAPLYMILAVVSVWFLVWIAVMPGHKKSDGPRNGCPCAQKDKHYPQRAVATVEEGDETFAEKPAKPSKPRKSKKARGE